LRQAYNLREGDFYPRVGSSIPDDWLQEFYTPISADNTYYYNGLFSKQTLEVSASNLNEAWSEEQCFTNFPYRAIYSDPQIDMDDVHVNNWLIYRPLSTFDFPQNNGKLIAIDNIQNDEVLVRFENRSLLYNALLTVDTNNPKSIFFGDADMFRRSPPIDFSNLDIGHVGSQNKFLLRTSAGVIFADAKRGDIFLMTGRQMNNLSQVTVKMSRFLKENLPFAISKYFPGVNTDNHFKGIGIHGVFDSLYNRAIITKLDFVPKSGDVKYDPESDRFYVETIGGRVYVSLFDENYFCNRSWTLSFNLDWGRWISFHSYTPLYYLPGNNEFYSGINRYCDFDAIAGELTEAEVVETTTIVYSCGLSGTAYKIQCALDGNVRFPDCSLFGYAIKQ
jgi:hypothetical protein